MASLPGHSSKKRLKPSPSASFQALRSLCRSGTRGRRCAPTIHCQNFLKKKTADFLRNQRFYGCGDRTRTCDLRVMSPTSYQLLYSAIYTFVVPVTGLEPVQYRYRGILSPLCLPIPPHRQLSAMIRIPYSPVIVKHGQGKPFKFFRQLPLQKVQTGARFRAIFRPEAHILAENPNAKEEIK